MCSNRSGLRGEPAATADLAARLSAAIDELAAAADGAAGDSGGELTARLASAWALLAEADPELAARTARYTP